MNCAVIECPLESRLISCLVPFLQKSARKRKLTSVDAANAHFKIPTLDLKETNFSEAQFERTYRDFQVVHVKNSTMGCKIPDDASSSEFRWQDIGGIFEKLSDKDKASWTVETMTTGDSAVLSNEFLVADPISHRAYCSFLIQNDEEIYRKTIQRLPFQEFPQTKWEYEPALWVFFCRNSIGNESLQGRPEHTDAITHDGTWHYQLSGRKQWRLRPTDELVLKLIEENSTLSTNDVFHVECCEGDVLVINTRLWFHNTIIPPQGCPSVSYARDFSLSESLCCTQGDDGGMTNLDGLYATIDVSYGTIVFTEDSMPDCALHRSSANANCEVVALDDGSQAVVSLRDIVAGEFFCVPDTSDEESSDGEGDVDIEESDGNDSGS